MKPAATIPVTCATCGRRLRGHPTITGRFAVARHRARNGSRCAGQWFYARPIERPVVAS